MSMNSSWLYTYSTRFETSARSVYYGDVFDTHMPRNQCLPTPTVTRSACEAGCATILFILVSIYEELLTSLKYVGKASFVSKKALPCCLMQSNVT